MSQIQALEMILAQVNGATFASIDTETVPRLTGGQKNPMQGQIRKLMIGGNIMLFTNKNSNGYNNMVRKHLIAEGKDPESFQLGELPWGQRIKDTPMIEHNGEIYLQVIFLRPGKVNYLHGVRPIEAADIEGLPVAREAEQGGLEDDNKVILRTFKLSSIKAITINKQRYVL